MDLEYLRSRYRDSMKRARNAASRPAEHSHEEVASFYARWILEEEARLANGSAAQGATSLSGGASASATMKPLGAPGDPPEPRQAATAR